MSIYKKKISVGAFLKRGEDIKRGDILEIANEGKQIPGEYGTQDVFLVKTASGKDGNVGFNQTSINNLIEGFGSDSINWIGKKVKVEVMTQIGKPPAYYFLHPDSELNEETGQFLIPGKDSSSKDDIPVVEDSEEIDPESISL